MRPKRAEAVRKVATIDKFRMFPGHQEHLAKSLSRQMTGLLDYFFDGESDPQNGVVA